MSKRTKRLVAGGAVVAVALGVSAFAVPNAFADNGVQAAYTEIQLLAVNDLHGNLEPPSGSSGEIVQVDEDGNETTVEAGGIEYLATHLTQARQGHDHSLTVAAGDLIGASPFLSAAFHDEPTIDAVEALGMDVSAVGNHEFDEGFAELQRIQNGGCHEVDGCVDPEQPYDGADFPFLGANVVNKDTGVPELPPVWIKDFGDGAKVGFIGMTLEGTGNIVSKAGIADLQFKDEVETANFYTRLLQFAGVESIVVLLHEGGLPASEAYNYDCDSPGAGDGISGPIVDIAENLDPEIDMVISGHTHQAYTCTIPDPSGNPRMVTSGSSFGRLFTEISLMYDPNTNDIAQTYAENHVVTRDVTPDPTESEIIAHYSELAEPIANREVGYISEDLTKGDSEARESIMGDVIADTQLAATSDPDTGGAQIALMNPGGVRADILYASQGPDADGVVTYGEAFTVQPFNNYLVTVDLTGEQIITLLQQQFSGPNEEDPQVLQPSAGFTYTVDESLSGADKVLVDTVQLNGEPLDPAASYRVTVNSFLVDGGDGFAVLPEGQNRLFGPLDIDAFTTWFETNTSASEPLVTPGADRITFL